MGETAALLLVVAVVDGEGGEALGGCSFGRRAAGTYKGAFLGPICRDCRSGSGLKTGDIGEVVAAVEGGGWLLVEDVAVVKEGTWE